MKLPESVEKIKKDVEKDPLYNFLSDACIEIGAEAILNAPEFKAVIEALESIASYQGDYAQINAEEALKTFNKWVGK